MAASRLDDTSGSENKYWVQTLQIAVRIGLDRVARDDLVFLDRAAVGLDIGLYGIEGFTRRTIDILKKDVKQLIQIITMRLWGS